MIVARYTKKANPKRNISLESFTKFIVPTKSGSVLTAWADTSLVFFTKKVAEATRLALKDSRVLENYYPEYELELQLIDIRNCFKRVWHVRCDTDFYDKEVGIFLREELRVTGPLAFRNRAFRGNDSCYDTKREAEAAGRKKIKERIARLVKSAKNPVIHLNSLESRYSPKAASELVVNFKAV